MKKLFLCLALLLVGCAGITNAINVVSGTSVTPGQAYIAANAFDAIEATATTYLQLPGCTAGGSVVCRSATAVAKIVPAIRIGRTARNALEAAVTSSGGAPVSTSLYSALTAQTNTLQQIVNTYGIGK